MKRYTSRRTVALLIVSAILLLACGNNNTQPSANTPDAPTKKGDAEVVMPIFY